MINRLLLALILASFILLSWNGICADMPQSRAPSEMEQIKFAVKFGSGDLNPKHFLHPPFFAYVLFGLYGFAFIIGKAAGVFHSVVDYQRLYFTDPVFFYLVARYLVLILSGLSMAIFYFISKRIFDKKAALLAALFVACSPVYIKLAHYAAPDMPMFFLAMASFYFAVGIFKEGRWKDYIFAGLLLGLALATKYGAAFMIVPIAAAHLLSPNSRGVKSRLLSKKLAALFVFILIGLFLGNPFMFLDYQRFFASFFEQGRRMSAFNYNFASWKTDKPGWLYILTDTMPFGLGGYIPAIFILAGIAYSVYRHKREDILLLSLILISYLAIGRWSVIKPRYFIFVFPFAFLLASRFLTELVENTALSKRVGTYFLCITTLFIIIQPLTAVMHFEKLITKKPVYVQAKDWIESNIPSGTSIVTFTRMPIVPNEESITRSLKKIADRRMGEGVMLKTLLRHMGDFQTVYNVYELPYPWREDYDDADFDFKKHALNGVRYFVLTEESEEYYANPARYGSQVAYMDSVKNNCALIKEFRQRRPKIEPGYISGDEYVQIYRYNG